MEDEAAINEFLAEEELIRVIPNFQHDVLRFVTGNYGPFAPQTAVEVPLWLACLLRKRRMCTVVPPTSGPASTSDSHRSLARSHGDSAA